ncbi:MAG TPA: SigE family RNA polymerase sigma factor [Jatrophihabitans sp.]|nr:SigE family RNA polymerase sigma factor [Jatrophihabitans sp.]
MPDFRIGAAQACTLSCLATEHGLTLTRFAYLICGDRDRAEDLVQDVLLAMHRRFGPVLPLADPVAYARRAIVNGNISWSRRSVSREIPTERLPEASTGFAEPDDQLWQLLGTLGRRQRAVLVLRYYLGYPDVDIAEMLGCRRATVRSLAARGLAELRVRLSAAQPGASS